MKDLPQYFSVPWKMKAIYVTKSTTKHKASTTPYKLFREGYDFFFFFFIFNLTSILHESHIQHVSTCVPTKKLT
jgi:hypothetical protein